MALEPARVALHKWHSAQHRADDRTYADRGHQEAEPLGADVEVVARDRRQELLVRQGEQAEAGGDQQEPSDVAFLGGVAQAVA